MGTYNKPQSILCFMFGGEKKKKKKPYSGHKQQESYILLKGKG